MSSDVDYALTYVRAIHVLNERGWCRYRREDADGRVCLAGALALALDLPVYISWEHPWLDTALTRIARSIHDLKVPADVIDHNDRIVGDEEAGRAEVIRLLMNAIVHDAVLTSGSSSPTLPPAEPTGDSDGDHT